MNRNRNVRLFGIAVATLGFALAACMPPPSRLEAPTYEPPSDPIVEIVGDLGSEDGTPVFVTDLSDTSPQAPLSPGNPPPAPTTDSVPPVAPPLFGAPLGGGPPPSMELDTDPDVPPVVGDLGNLGDPPRPRTTTVINTFSMLDFIDSHSPDVPPVAGDLGPPESSAPNSPSVPSSGLGAGNKAWDIGVNYALPQRSTTPAAPMQPSIPNWNQVLVTQIMLMLEDDDWDDDWYDISPMSQGLHTHWWPRGLPVRRTYFPPVETAHFENAPPPPNPTTPHQAPLHYDPDAPIPVFPPQSDRIPTTDGGRTGSDTGTGYDLPHTNVPPTTPTATTRRQELLNETTGLQSGASSTPGDHPANATTRRQELLNETTTLQSGPSVTPSDHPSTATARRRELLEDAKTNLSSGASGGPGPRATTPVTRKQELLEETKTDLQSQPHSTGMGAAGNANASNKHGLLEEQRPLVHNRAISQSQQHQVLQPQQHQIYAPQQRQIEGGNSALHEQTFAPSSGGHSFGAPGGFSAPRPSGGGFGRKE